MGQFGLDKEIDRLRRDKQVLMVELVKLRQQQQSTKASLDIIEQKLKRNELRQQQMMSFLAKAVQNPDFIQQLVQQKDSLKELNDAIKKKRRRPIEQGPVNGGAGDIGNGGEGGSFMKLEPQDYSDLSGFEVPEVDQFSVEMQGLTENQNVPEPEPKAQGKVSGDRLFGEMFWENLLNEGIDEDLDILGVEAETEDVDVLAEQLGYLGGSPK